MSKFCYCYYHNMSLISGEPTLFALFRNQQEAELGINALVQAGFDARQVGYLGPGEQPSEVSQRDPKKPAVVGMGAGTVAGGIAGGLLGAAASAAVPGLGAVIVAGILVPLVVGAASGAGVGVTLGSLMGSTLSDHPAIYFLQEVGAGRSLVSVSGDRLGEASSILLRCGALEASAVRV
jgi:hypothetical protein